jgi:hypothetical protein
MRISEYMPDLPRFSVRLDRAELSKQSSQRGCGGFGLSDHGSSLVKDPTDEVSPPWELQVGARPWEQSFQTVLMKEH